MYDRILVGYVHSGARDRAAAALEAAVTGLAGALGLHRAERRLEASSSPAFGLHDLAEAEGCDLIALGSSDDDAAQALLDATRDRVSLLVVGSRGYGPVRRTLLGSVSTAVVRAVPAPVLVVPRGVEPGS